MELDKINLFTIRFLFDINLCKSPRHARFGE